MVRRTMLSVGSGLVAAAVLNPGAAMADAIDGNWCAADGRVMTITGPAIVTPGGRAISGDYARHAFAYVVPTGEADAGTEISMVLLNEDTIELSPGPGAHHEIWHRCDVIS